MKEKTLMILKDRNDAMNLLKTYYIEDCDMDDKMELLRRCNEFYHNLLPRFINDNRLRDYEIESYLDDLREDVLHRIASLCPFNGFNGLDDDGTWYGYKSGDKIPTDVLEKFIGE